MTPSTSDSVPVKLTAAVENEKGLQLFHLDTYQAFMQAPLEGKKPHAHLSPWLGSSMKILRLLKRVENVARNVYRRLDVLEMS